MKIGELVTLTNTQVETIRFYEQEKLLAHGEQAIHGHR